MNRDQNLTEKVHGDRSATQAIALYICFAGFLLTISAQLVSVFLVQPVLRNQTLILAIGAFAVWIPIAVVSKSLTHAWRSNYWRTLFGNSPRWLMWLVLASLTYAVINTVLWAIAVQNNGAAAVQGPIERSRFACGQIQALYLLAGATLCARQRSSTTGKGTS
jgi:hypothetical protein